MSDTAATQLAALVAIAESDPYDEHARAMMDELVSNEPAMTPDDICALHLLPGPHLARLRATIGELYRQTDPRPNGHWVYLLNMVRGDEPERIEWFDLVRWCSTLYGAVPGNRSATAAMSALMNVPLSGAHLFLMWDGRLLDELTEAQQDALRALLDDDALRVWPHAAIVSGLMLLMTAVPAAIFAWWASRTDGAQSALALVMMGVVIARGGWVLLTRPPHRLRWQRELRRSLDVATQSVPLSA